MSVAIQYMLILTTKHTLARIRFKVLVRFGYGRTFAETRFLSFFVAASGQPQK